jgi:hypothetical protein
MATSPDFPTPTRIRGRLFFDRHVFENFKRQLLGLEPLERDPKAVIELVPAGQAATELGRHRRTLGRRIVETRAHAPETSAA